MQNQVKIAAYSRNKYGDEMLSMLVTFPRIILAEVNTHRMLCKNTSSSRAIPFLKMVESVVNNPFIPFAFQKHHPGMQGTEYLDTEKEVEIFTFINTLIDESKKLTKDSEKQRKMLKRIEELSIVIETYTPISQRFVKRTLANWWLHARDSAIHAASIMYAMGVTKQLCNRLLEPFMWTTMLITGSVEHGWKNFFNLRCPAYTFHDENGEYVYKSRKETIKSHKKGEIVDFEEGKVLLKDLTDLQWRSVNQSQAEIHIQDLAEKIYDALNEATPKVLQSGDWHIPFEDEIGFVGDIMYKLDTNNGIFKDYDTQNKVKISTSMAARTSYTVIDAKGTTFEKHIDLHEDLLKQKPPHSSPTEHCHRCMDDSEYTSFVKGEFAVADSSEEYVYLEDNFIENQHNFGWCYSAKGFIPYRYFIDNGIKN